MNVFVITKGSYSDYHICAVTTDPERAKRLAEIYSDRMDDACVETYDTEETPHLDPNDHLPFVVNFSQTGEVLKSSGRAAIEYPFTPGVSAGKDSLDRLAYVRVALYAPDWTTALKIAQDKRAQFLAEQAGL